MNKHPDHREIQHAFKIPHFYVAECHMKEGHCGFSNLECPVVPFSCNQCWFSELSMFSSVFNRILSPAQVPYLTILVIFGVAYYLRGDEICSTGSPTSDLAFRMQVRTPVNFTGCCNDGTDIGLLCSAQSYPIFNTKYIFKFGYICYEW